MNLRRACEHGEYAPHLWLSHEQPLYSCPGGTEPTTDELLAMLVEEGVLEKEIYGIVGDRRFRWQTPWREVSS